jgi:hypothetical protein
MPQTFSAEAGWVIFTRDGRAQFGWRDLKTGEFHAEADGQCIADAIAAVEFYSDVVH